jgi:SOUL heme-binding protein
MLSRIATAVHLVAEMAGSVVGLRHGTEEPRHTVEKLTANVEIRRYGPRIAAETAVTADEESARSEGFRRLAGYIFGANRTATKIAMTASVAQEPRRSDGEKIAMTAPVEQSAQSAQSADRWVIRFFMPADKSLDSLPEPNDSAVKLVEVPAQTLAVCRFSGGRSPSAVRAKTDELMGALRETGFEPTGTPVAWFYDPPWTIAMLRRNEIAVPIERTSDRANPG